MSLARVACLACFLVAAMAYSPSDLVGNWVGTCSQYVYANASGANTCTGSSKVLLNYPYSIKFYMEGSEMYYDFMDHTMTTNIMDPSGMMRNYTLSSFGLDGVRVKSVTPVDSPDGSDMWCVDAPTDGALLVSVSQVGAQMMYTEYANWMTSTGANTFECPSATNTKIYCNKEMYNYMCLAHKVL